MTAAANSATPGESSDRLPPGQALPDKSPPARATDSVREGILLIAHGSRRPAANADLVTLAGLLSTVESQAVIETAFLELAEPNIQAGGAQCVARGATRVRMLPYFLSAGAHVVEDLQEHRAQLAGRFPNVEFVLCPHLGLHPLMVEIVRQRLRETAPTLHQSAT